ncbi:MAG: hypothetical protein WC435_01245 [Candidatus Paceibacterota bacterium]
MQYHSLKNIMAISPNNQDIKIRITISESERIVKKDRENKIKSQPLSIEEKIIKFSPPLESN